MRMRGGGMREASLISAPSRRRPSRKSLLRSWAVSPCFLGIGRHKIHPTSFYIIFMMVIAAVNRFLRFSAALDGKAGQELLSATIMTALPSPHSQHACTHPAPARAEGTRATRTHAHSTSESRPCTSLISRSSSPKACPQNQVHAIT